MRRLAPFARFGPLLLACAGLILSAAAPAPESAPPAAADTTSLHILPEVVLPEAIPPDATLEQLKLGADEADRMTMPVAIGGNGPWPFIIDTGSQRSIVATELARHLALPELPPVNIISIAGPAVVAAVQLGELSFGSHVVSDLRVLSVARESLGGAGLIGLDGLRNKRLTLDFRQRRLEIGRSKPARSSSEDRNVIVVEARTRLGQLILVNSRIDGRQVAVILDTGAEISVGNMALFRSLKEKRLLVPPRPVTITSVTGQSVTAQFTVVRQLNIAAVQLDNVPMVFLDAAPFAELDLAERPALLLGMGVLRMFDRVAIDFGSRHIDFELPRSGREAPGGRLASL